MKNLELALGYLSKHFFNELTVKKLPDDEWMEFHVWVHKKDSNNIGFYNPCLTTVPQEPQNVVDDKIIVFKKDNNTGLTYRGLEKK